MLRPSTLLLAKSGVWITSTSIQGGGFSSVAKSILSHGGRFDTETENFVTHTLKGTGHDASEDGTGRGVPLTVAFHENQRGELSVNEQAGSLKSGGGKPRQGYPAILQVAGTLTSGSGGMRTDKQQRTIDRSGVRRLTPRECERLQGFPDDYTLINYRGKPAKDSPRYEALGNSMARPVVLWIGQRIAEVDAL